MKAHDDMVLLNINQIETIRNDIDREEYQVYANITTAVKALLLHSF